jgi:hypothetical protein
MLTALLGFEGVYRPLQRASRENGRNVIGVTADRGTRETGTKSGPPVGVAAAAGLCEVAPLRSSLLPIPLGFRAR